MNYTKGEWKVTKGFKVVAGIKSAQAVADVFGETAKEVEANAHLIAAAPDMYEALKALPEQVKWIPEVAKALAKAEGKDV